MCAILNGMSRWMHCRCIGVKVSRVYARRTQPVFEACSRCKGPGAQCPAGCNAGTSVDCCIVCVLTSSDQTEETTVILGVDALRSALDLPHVELLKLITGNKSLGALDDRVPLNMAYDVFMTNRTMTGLPRLEDIHKVDQLPFVATQSVEH